MKLKILITGSAGFIGFHLAKDLIKEGYNIFGIDNINDYYDVSLKYDRLEQLGINKNDVDEYTQVTSKLYPCFTFAKIDISDAEAVKKLFASHKFDVVCNLAAQAGVRYSIDHPEVYIQSNVVGFLNILEGCRHSDVGHLLYASSSSVYGMNKKVPFSTKDNVDHPISLYAATKKSNELMAYTYAHLYGLPTTGLRFFTVYGPWGRPDMAYYSFTKSIVNNETIKVFNNGNMSRDFTYIDDIIKAINKIIKSPPYKKSEKDLDEPPYKLYNIGNSNPEKLIDFIKVIEEAIGKRVDMKMLPMQPGDVVTTYADVTELEEHYNYSPNTKLKEGIGKFIEWYKSYYNV